MNNPELRNRSGAETESVWDYPRPPRLERSPHRVRVDFGGLAIADSTASYRVLETSHPPVFYIPRTDICMEHLHPGEGSSFCEWKGAARYYSLVVGESQSANAAWCYPVPSRGFTEIAGFIAFYPNRVDACFVDGEKVQAQDGDFYGGWITSRIAGPFKGAPGTRGW